MMIDTVGPFETLMKYPTTMHHIPGAVAVTIRHYTILNLERCKITGRTAAQQFSGGAEKNHEQLQNTRYPERLPNTSLEHFGYTNPLDRS
jgi:hypothetical protein